jgi:hypothetical protein
MNAAPVYIPWLPLPEAVAGVARHRGCTPEAAKLQIVGEGKGGRIKARGTIKGRSVSLQIVGKGKGGRIKARGVIKDQSEGWGFPDIAGDCFLAWVSPLPGAWNGTIDLAGATMKPPEVSYEIADLELCFIDLIAAGLLPAPAERARWPAEEAIAYLVKGVPLPWGAWQGASASPAEIEQAEINLGEAIRAGVPAWGRPRPFAQKEPIPADNFDPEMIEDKRPPVAHRSKVIVDRAGYVTTWPRQRSADYRGPRWQAIEVDSAALRQARLGAEPEPALPSTLAVSKPAQSSVEVPAPVSPSSQEPTSIALLVKTTLAELASSPPSASSESEWDPRTEWSVATVKRELQIKGSDKEVVIETLPKLYGNDIPAALDNLVAGESPQAEKLRKAIKKLLEETVQARGRTIRDNEIPSRDTCSRFLVAWRKYRARQPHPVTPD